MLRMTQSTIPMRVLVMEQDAGVLSQLVSVLHGQAIQTRAVGTSEDALDELRFANHAVLVFRYAGDVQQTILFVQKVRACVPQVQIVLLTQKPDVDLWQEAALSDVFTSVRKKGSDDQWVRAVYHAIHHYHAMALQRSQMRFDALANDLSERVIRYLPDGTLTFANRAFLESVHLTPMDLKGRLVFEFVEMSQRKKLSKLWQKFTPRNTVLKSEVQMLMPAGSTVEYRWTSRAIYDAQDRLEEIQSAISRTAPCSEKSLPDPLSPSHSQLRDAELAQVARLNIMGEMASSIAHELNQPLAAIANYNRGSIRRLERLPDIPPVILDAMQAAAKQSERAGKIMRRLRDLVQKRATFYESVGIRALLKEVVELLDPMLRTQGIILQVSDGLKEHWVYADTIQIQQVLINLIRNAVQAMTPVAADRNMIQLHVAQYETNMIRVDVLDQGHGLGDKDPCQFFDMFVSGNSEGMGLGLAISRTIVESHGGKCWAANRAGGGAVFSFTLPTKGFSVPTHAMQSVSQQN